MEGARHALGLDVEVVRKAHRFGVGEVRLHGREGRGRAGRDALGHLAHARLERVAWHGAVDEARQRRLRARQRGREKEQLARAARADDAVKEPRAAEIARKRDVGEGGGELRVVHHHAQVAGEGERQPRPRRRAVDGRDRHLAHLVQETRRLHDLADVGDLFVDLLGLRVGEPSGHVLDVAAGRERLLVALRRRARQHDHADRVVGVEFRQAVADRRPHGPRHRVARRGPVQRDGGDAPVARNEDVAIAH